VPVNSVNSANSNRRARFFFVAMAAAVIATVFAGFAPTFYLRSSFPQHRPMSVLLHVHGVVFSIWVSVFLVQTILISRGSYRLHRRLGWIASGIAVAMILLVTAAVIEELRRIHGFPPPPLALALSAFDIVVFGILVSLGIRYRQRPDWHKRLMLSATIVLLGAPMFRIVAHAIGLQDPGRVGLLATVLVDAFFVPCLVYDFVRLRRIHPAYLVAIPLVVTDQILQVEVVSWPPWIRLASWLQGLVS
jgi:hypothetical protein